MGSMSTATDYYPLTTAGTNGIDRGTILDGLADGYAPPVVFGEHRQDTATQLAAWLRGIKPTETERAAAAVAPAGDQLDRKVRAYDNGVQHLRNAYYELGALYQDLGCDPDSVRRHAHLA